MRQRRRFGRAILLSTLGLLPLRSVTGDFMFWVGGLVWHGACCDGWDERMDGGRRIATARVDLCTKREETGQSRLA